MGSCIQTEADVEALSNNVVCIFNVGLLNSKYDHQQCMLHAADANH